MNRLIILISCFVMLASFPGQAQITAIQCKQIIDGKNNQATGQSVILVEGSKIKAVGGKDIIPKGATVVDLPGYTLMPGFIDLHCHPLGNGDDDYQTYHLKILLPTKLCNACTIFRGCSWRDGLP